MRRLSFYMFLLAAAAVILFLSWSLFSENTGSGADFPPNAGGPAGEASGTSQAEQEKLKNLAAYQGGEREILDDMAEAMTDLPASADASLDYLRAIQPHSQASIALAECYRSPGPPTIWSPSRKRIWKPSTSCSAGGRRTRRPTRASGTPS